MIAAEPTFVLLDEQQVVFNTILAKVRGRHLGTGQTAFLVLGGPGTGKSVLAVNLLGELSRQGHVTQHVTGSKALTENLRKVVGSRASAQFGYFNGFATAEPALIDVLICDEITTMLPGAPVSTSRCATACVWSSSATCTRAGPMPCAPDTPKGLSRESCRKVGSGSHGQRSTMRR